MSTLNSLKILDFSVFLVLFQIHENPIFYKLGLEPIKILKKDTEINLKNGDYFSLLPNDVYTYEIKIVEDQPQNPDPVDKAQASGSGNERLVPQWLSNLSAGTSSSKKRSISASSGDEEDGESKKRKNDNNKTVVADENPPGDPESPPETSVANLSSTTSEANQRTDSSALPAPATILTSTVSHSTPTPVSDPTPAPDLTSKTSEVSIKQEPATDEVTVKQEPVDPSAATTSTNPVSAANVVQTPVTVVKPEPADPDGNTTAPASAVPQNPANGLRPSCQFGIRCYR